MPGNGAIAWHGRTLGIGLEADHLVLVVILDHVFDDCSRLPQSGSRVKIFNRRDSSVGIDTFVGGLFLLWEF